MDRVRNRIGKAGGDVTLVHDRATIGIEDDAVAAPDFHVKLHGNAMIADAIEIPYPTFRVHIQS